MSRAVRGRCKLKYEEQHSGRKKGYVCFCQGIFAAFFGQRWVEPSDLVCQLAVKHYNALAIVPIAYRRLE